MRRPALKIVLGVLLLAAALGLAAWLWIDAAAERRWTSMQKRISELKAEARAREHRRPPRPGLLPGVAWDDYLEAMALVRGVEGGLLNSDPVDPAILEVLPAWPRALELIRSGARRATARHPDLRVESTEVISLRGIGLLCEAAALGLAREGDAREAARVLLDLLQFGNDAMRDVIDHPSMVTVSLYDPAIRGMLALKLADPREVGKELERLEKDLPTGEASLANHMLKTATAIQNPSLLASATPWRSKKYGFSGRLMIAAAFETTEDLLRSAAGVDALPFAGAEALAAEIRTRAAAAGNPVLGEFSNFMIYVYEQRAALAKLRLLRAALDPALDLEDPFGDRILRGPNKVWSRCYDGVDDGGTEPLDFVLTIP